MNKELENILFSKYPILYQKREETLMAIGFDFADGWYDIIDRLSAELEKINNDSEKFKVIAIQAKEKFAGLRFYTEVLHPEEFDEEEIRAFRQAARDKVYIAEDEAAITCEYCGTKESVKVRDDLSWIKTLCDNCNQKRMEKYDKPDSSC